MPELDALLQVLFDRDGSDLHLRVGQPPTLRIRGALERMESNPLTSDNISRLMKPILNDSQRRLFEDRGEFQTTHASETARFRVNIFRQRGSIAAVFRLIPLAIRSLADLGLPPSAHDLCFKPHGLLLIGGPRGSGKSTTLAGYVQHINLNKKIHVVTIEDPIEFIHADQVASIDQRQIGDDAMSFLATLRHAVGHDADAVFLSELRDAEIIHAAIAAAETGHLVIASVSTGSACRTIQRLIDAYAPDEQRRARSQIANCLIGVISQTLLTRVDAPARAAAFGVLIANPLIRSLIREGKISQIQAEIELGVKSGMMSLDQALATLVHKGTVRHEDAIAKSTNPRAFEQRIRGVLPGGA